MTSPLFAIRMCFAAVIIVLARAQSGIGQTDIASTLKHKLFSKVAHSPCVRLLKVGGSVGCSSDKTGVIGFLFPIVVAADVDTFTSLPRDVPRIAVISPMLLTPLVLDTLAATKQFVGAAVLSGPFPPMGTSDDASLLPVGFQQQWVWNPLGRGLLQRRFNFPIIELADSTESSRILNFALRNVEGGTHIFPQLAMRLSFYMG